MNHALIMDDNMIISRSIQRRLENLGFTSFDHTWTEEQAVTAARRCKPNLVIVGDEVASGSVLGAVQRISSEMAVPILMVSADPLRAESHITKDAKFKGPFTLSQIDEVVNTAIAAHNPHSRNPIPRIADVPTHRTGGRNQVNPR